ELRTRVERRGRFVEDQHVGLAHVGARDRDLLPFAAGQVHALAEALADELVVAVRQLRDDLVGEALRGRALDARTVVAGIDAADRDVLGRTQVVAHEILEDHADVVAQFVEVVVAKIPAIEQDAALIRAVQPREELDHGGLARAMLADQGEHLGRAEMEIEMAYRPALRARIAEADVLEAKPFADRTRERQRIRGRTDLRFDLEERKQVVEIQRLAGGLRETDQQVLEQVAQAPERTGEKREVADAEIA